MKEIKIKIYEYSPENGFQFSWEDGFMIKTDIHLNPKEIIITANKEGLISLAQHLLTLAQDNFLKGEHFHLDEFNSLEPNSIELIIEKG